MIYGEKKEREVIEGRIILKRRIRKFSGMNLPLGKGRRGGNGTYKVSRMRGKKIEALSRNERSFNLL